MEARSILHHKAVLLASDLRFLAQERWSNALAYQATRGPLNYSRLQRSEIETRRKLDEREHLFSNNDEQANESLATQAGALLDSYRVIREGVPDLYAQFIKAIDAGDLEHQTKLISLLSDKIRLVRATLDDLTVYHIKTEQAVNGRYVHLYIAANCSHSLGERCSLRRDRLVTLSRPFRPIQSKFAHGKGIESCTRSFLHLEMIP